MSSFQDLGFFFVHNNSEAEAQRSYLWVIVKEKPFNLEKTTYSVLSVLVLTYDHIKQKLPIKKSTNFIEFF